MQEPVGPFSRKLSVTNNQPGRETSQKSDGHTYRGADNSARPIAQCISFDASLVKAKAVPLQAWSDPKSSRKLRFPDFMTTTQDGGKVVSLTHRPPLPQEIHLVLISVRG